MNKFIMVIKLLMTNQMQFILNHAIYICIGKWLWVTTITDRIHRISESQRYGVIEIQNGKQISHLQSILFVQRSPPNFGPQKWGRRQYQS